jgi:GNAT superfamily N-acetyltransferase
VSVINSGPILRAATAADVPAMHAMIRELADFEQLLHEVKAVEDDLRRALFGTTPVAEALVVTVGGETAAFALFYTTYSTFAGKPGLYLEDLFVRPEHRGRGLGKRLLAAGAEIAVARGLARYEWSVLDWNARAIEFYEGRGAEMHAAWRRMRVEGEPLRRLGATAASRTA